MVDALAVSQGVQGEGRNRPDIGSNNWPAVPGGAMTCNGPSCDRPVLAKGLCSPHYKQQWRGEDLKVLVAPLTERVLDLLQIDGGWLTKAGIADRLGVTEDQALHALQRLRDGGMAEMRSVGLSVRKHRTGAVVDQRVEWSALCVPAHWGVA